MNTRKFEIFYNTATQLNMTKVAKELYMSQPSISQAIKEIEEEVGARLFDRIGKKLYLTSEGELYLRYVRRILNLYKEATDKLDEMTQNGKGRIRIGASTTIGIYLLPELIRGFVEEYKNIEIALSIDNTAKIEELLLENKIDIAFVEGRVVSEEIVQEVLGKDEIVFICSKDNPLSEQVEVTPLQLQQQKLIMREKGSGTREAVERYLEEQHIDYTMYMELGDSEAIKRCVKADLGIGCISVLCVKEEDERSGISVFRLSETYIERDLFLIYHKDKFISSNLKNLMQFAYRQ